MFLWSCTKEINVSLPSNANELVVNCVYNNQEPIKVFMTKTVNPKDTIYNTGDSSYFISLTEDGNFKEIIKFNTSTKVYESTVIAKASSEYVLSVNQTNRKATEVKATNKLPNNIKLQNVQFIDSIYKDGVNYFGELSFTINDPEGYDYYRLNIYYFNSTTQEYRLLPYSTNDQVLTDDSTINLNNTRYFSDKIFKSKSHVFKILVQAGNYYTNTGRNNLLIETASLSKDFYKYFLSLEAYNKAYNPLNPLSNPVSLYSNTSNNIGIFAGYVIDRDTIK
jgi:hypothetical protein